MTCAVRVCRLPNLFDHLVASDILRALYAPNGDARYGTEQTIFSKQLLERLQQQIIEGSCCRRQHLRSGGERVHGGRQNMSAVSRERLLPRDFSGSVRIRSEPSS